MAKRELPSPEVLRQLLRYDPETGKLFWKERGPEWFAPKGQISAEGLSGSWNSRHAGKVAFTSPSRDYASGSLLGIPVMAHCIIWAMHADGWPNDQIDHINGDKWDNRLENLRPVSAAENCRNKPRQTNNKSGYIGVNWCADRKTWRAQLKVNGHTHHIGHFDSAEAASAARKAADLKFGFHENHGR